MLLENSRNHYGHSFKRRPFGSEFFLGKSHFDACCGEPCDNVDIDGVAEIIEYPFGNDRPDVGDCCQLFHRHPHHIVHRLHCRGYSLGCGLSDVGYRQRIDHPFKRDLFRSLDSVDYPLCGFLPESVEPA